MAELGYKVISTQPWTYLDKTGKVVHGYRVSFEIVKFSEVHFVEVTTLDPQVVNPQITKVVKDRESLG